MKLQNKHILYFILLMAVATRCYQLFEIPYSFDEFSAIFRLNYSSFSELIEKGVKIDGHPAGIQVFLYYWIKLFGRSEWVVKLPFIVMGVASVSLLYGIGKHWFNQTVGLIAAAFLATMQYAIIYSQIARPYSSGLFFVLLMVWAWTKLIQSNKLGFSWNTLVYILAASLATYAHHFSLLAVAIIGLTGLFLINKKDVLKYIGINTFIILLYIPHLPIFFYQLNVGGIGGWLMKPSADFLLQYLHYLFHFSWIVIGLVITLVIIGWTSPSKSKKIKWMVVSLVWFLLPYLIGLTYSIYVDSVLQFSVLIFTFPFLFFVLFGAFKELSVKWNLILVLLILIINTFTLVVNRKHYHVFYKPIEKQSFVDYKEVKQTYPKLLAIINSHQNIGQYYQEKYQVDSNYYFYEDVPNSIKKLKQYLQENQNNHDHVYLARLAAASSLLVPIIQEYYPYIEVQNDYFLGATYIFSKKQTKPNITHLSFDEDIPLGWEGIQQERIKNDSLTHNKMYDYSTIEYGPSFEIPIKELKLMPKDYIDVSVDVKHKGAVGDVILCLTIAQGKETIHWGGASLVEFLLEDSSNNQTIIHHSLQVNKEMLAMDSLTVKAFLWNKSKSSLFIDNFTLQTRKGNPYMYGLIEEIDE